MRSSQRETDEGPAREFLPARNRRGPGPCVPPSEKQMRVRPVGSSQRETDEGPAREFLTARETDEGLARAFLSARNRRGSGPCVPLSEKQTRVRPVRSSQRETDEGPARAFLPARNRRGSGP